MNSIWKINSFKYPSLKEHIKCEILVIGGGLAGILTAYQLADKHDVVLVEKNTLASSTTSKTTGKITSLQGILYQDLIKNYNVKMAKDYFDSQEKMIDLYQKIIKKHQIDCDFKLTNGILFTSDEVDKLLKEAKSLTKMGVKYSLVDKDDKHDIPASIPFKKAIILKNQATFNPLKFISGLPKNFKIFENSEVLKIRNHVAYGKDFTIEAENIVVATNFPIKDIPGHYYLKLHPSMAYTIAIPNTNSINGAYIETNENKMSYRNYQDYLIICGLDHRTGHEDSDKKLENLKEIASRFSPNNHEFYWANEDMMTFDKIPYIGKYSYFNNNLYVITGFNKWGMANSLLASTIIKDLIENRHNPYYHLFSPLRIRLLKELPAFFVNGYVNTVSILSSFLIKPSNKTIPKNSARILSINGKKKAVYVDQEGIRHFAPARCEHLKSILHFNPNTLTWDCPCHGSIYSIDGQILHGPAN